MRKLTAALSASVLFVAACSDASREAGVTAPMAAPQVRSLVAGTCTTMGALETLARQVFGSQGGPNVNSVLGKLDNLQKKLDKGDLAKAQEHARDIVAFVQKKAEQGRLPGTAAQVRAFISGVLCYAGLSPDTFLIQPTDAPQVLVTSNGQSGISLEGNTVTVPTLLTLTPLPSTGPSPLDTKLDQYPSYVGITSSSQLTKPAVVAVCPTSSVPAEIRARLRLGHQKNTGFAIAPAADGSFLTCPTSTAQSRVPQWLRTVASLVLPRVAYAAVEERGGVGGSATEFSDFGAVDPVLEARGGVGGSATEFQRREAAGPRLGLAPDSTGRGANRTLSVGARLNTVSGGVCTAVEVTAGTALEPECRPVVTITTHNGTILTNVPVSWAVVLGGGTIAPEVVATHVCGTFGATAATATNVAGKAAICWNLGPTAGTNTATATPSAGGDAPAGVTFSPSGFTFTATGLRITPAATATGESLPYDGLPHAGSGTCSHGLAPALSYTGGSAPVNAGSYTLTVTCGAGNPNYNVATATAPITISRRAATATAGSGSMTFGQAEPVLPCAVTGLLASDAGAVTCSTSIPPHPTVGVYPTSVSLGATSLNYLVTSVAGTLTVGAYLQYSCFDSPLSATIPPTSAGFTRGATLLVKCELLGPGDVSLTGVSGNLLVESMGPSGTSAPVSVLSVTNVPFEHPFPDVYRYWLSTAPAEFTAGTYFRVTVTWNDGSTTVGWFYLRP